VLGILVEMNCNFSSRIFLGFLSSVLGWIRSNLRAKIWRLISFLFKGPINNGGMQPVVQESLNIMF
jgi:hypothetical protein